MNHLESYQDYARSWHPLREEELLENPDLPARAVRGELTDAEAIALFRVAEVNFPDELTRFCEAAIEDLPTERLEEIRERALAARELFELQKEQMRRRSARRAQLSIVK
jgi:hypothetical protein